MDRFEVNKMSVNKINNYTNRLENDQLLNKAVNHNRHLANNLDINNLGSRINNITETITPDTPINEGNGDNLVITEEGNGYISGGNGNDIIFGGEGNTEIQGDNGFDIIYGEAGNDKIHGGNGADYINSGIGDDSISGGNGNDVIVAGTGNNFVQGGNGTDTVIFEGASDNFNFSFDELGNIVITDASNPENKTTTTEIENFLFITDDSEELYSKEDIEAVINDTEEDNELSLEEEVALLDLEVNHDGNEFENWSGGLEEKWLRGNDKEWYYIVPNGDLYRWDSESKDGMFNGEDTLIGNFDESFYNDTEEFQSLTEELTQLSNPTNDPDIDSLDLEVNHDGNEFENWSGGLEEKWLRGNDKEWYYIVPNGDLYRWDSESKDGMFNGEDTLLGNIGEDYYEDINLFQELT